MAFVGVMHGQLVGAGGVVVPKYLLMDFCGGGTLRDALYVKSNTPKPPLPPSLILRCAQELAEGV